MGEANPNMSRQDIVISSVRHEVQLKIIVVVLNLSWILSNSVFLFILFIFCA